MPRVELLWIYPDILNSMAGILALEESINGSRPLAIWATSRKIIDHEAHGQIIHDTAGLRERV